MTADQAKQFFGDMTVRGPVHINSATVEQLIRESLAFPAIASASKEVVWLYAVAENLIAGTKALAAKDKPDPYVMFSSANIAFRGDARFNLHRWNYANYALGGGRRRKGSIMVQTTSDPGSISVPMSSILDALEGVLSDAERTALFEQLIGLRPLGVAPGDRITADLFDQVLSDINDLAKRVAMLEGAGDPILHVPVITQIVPGLVKTGQEFTVSRRKPQRQSAQPDRRRRDQYPARPDQGRQQPDPPGARRARHYRPSPGGRHGRPLGVQPPPAAARAAMSSFPAWPPISRRPSPSCSNR